MASQTPKASEAAKAKAYFICPIIPVVVKRGLFIVLFVVLLPAAARAADFYVAPASGQTPSPAFGSPTAPCTLAAPCTLHYFLNRSSVPAENGHPGLQPGDTIWLRGGDYLLSNVTSDLYDLHGNSASRITVRNYADERSRIVLQQVLTIWYGSYTDFWGIEIFDNQTLRASDSYLCGATQGQPAEMSFRGHHLRFIACVFHDYAGNGFQQEAEGTEFHDCLFYYMGFLARNRSWGNALYIQNSPGSTETKKIFNSIFFQQFGHSFQIFASDNTPGTSLKNVDVIGNAVFQAGSLASGDCTGGTNVIFRGGSAPSDNLEFRDNIFYQANVGDQTIVEGTNIALEGYQSGGTNLRVINNIVHDGSPGVRINNFNPTVFTGNIVSGTFGMLHLDWGINSNRTWENNTYFYVPQGGFPGAFRVWNGSSFSDFNTLSGWQSFTGTGCPGTSADCNSTLTQGYPNVNRTIVRPSAIFAGRANVYVYNPQNLAQVTVDLSGAGLTHGAQYKVQDSQNFFGAAWQAFTYNSAVPTITITLPHTNAPVSEMVGLDDSRNYQPVGANGHPCGYTDCQNAKFFAPPVHTSREFNAFVLIQTAGQGTPPTAPSGLTAAAVSSSQINLSWTDNSGDEDGFKVERCQGAGCTNFAQIAQVGANVTNFGNTGLAAGTTYRYRVRAFNGGGDSGYSNEAGATTLGGAYALTASPSTVAAGGTITVNWTAPSGRPATDWIGLYRVGDPNTSYLSYQYTGGAASGSTTFTAPSTAGQYEFRYLLENGYTDTARSNPVTVTTSGEPYMLTASPSTVAAGGTITVNWTAPSGRPTTDWIGLYRVGDPNTSYLSYQYTGGAASGSTTFTAPSTAGQYEFRYLLENGYTDTARSNPVTVN